MTTYTVIDRSSGEALHTGLTAREAAYEILTYDEREYEIRQDEDGGWTLWSRHQVANRGWERTVLFSIHSNQGEAEADIFAQVIAADWPRHPEVMTDTDYARMLAELDN